MEPSWPRLLGALAFTLASLPFPFSRGYRNALRRAAEHLGDGSAWSRSFVRAYLGWGWLGLTFGSAALVSEVARFHPEIDPVAVPAAIVLALATIVLGVLSETVFWCAGPRWLVPSDMRSDRGSWWSRRDEGH